MLADADTTPTWSYRGTGTAWRTFWDEADATERAVWLRRHRIKAKFSFPDDAPRFANPNWSIEVGDLPGLVEFATGGKADQVFNFLESIRKSGSIGAIVTDEGVHVVGPEDHILTDEEEESAASFYRSEKPAVTITFDSSKDQPQT